MTSLYAYCICGNPNPLPSQSTTNCGQWLFWMDVREGKLFLIGSFVSASVSPTWILSIKALDQGPILCFLASIALRIGPHHGGLQVTL